MRQVLLIGALLMLSGCERGEVVSGSVTTICGGERPCNFHITAPVDLVQGIVAIDGVETVSLFPGLVEHPGRNLLLRIVGIQSDSKAAVSTFHLPAGPHVIRITKPGWQPIERKVMGTGSAARIELAIPGNELRKLSAETVQP